MFNDPVSFTGATRVEVISVLANCGRDTDRARRALVTWIRHKQDKGRTTEHILAKLRDIESKFIKDTTLHSAFRDARAETCLPRAPDLPLPSSVKRKSNEQTPESLPTPKSVGRASFSSSVNEPYATSTTTSPPVSPLHISPDSSWMSGALPGYSKASAQVTYPQSAVSLRSPRIQIPRDRSLRHGPSSPVTSSPEDRDPHTSRYNYMSHPVGSSSQPTGLMTPVSASPPEPRIHRDQNLDLRGRSSYGLVSPPSPVRITIPISSSPSQRGMPHSPPNSSSDESDYYPRRYRPMSQPIGPIPSSPGHIPQVRRRVTSPSTCPPDLPLPPIPSGDQGVDSKTDKLKKSLPGGYPNTPVRPPTLHPGTPVRPLPIQPIPSPVPGSDESESHDTIGEDTLRQNWQGSVGDLPSDIVVRQDSPVYEFRDDHASSISPPPPYADQLGAYVPPDMPSIGVSLERAVNKCGGSSEVRVVVSKCIGFHRGYEPPYWQSRLQACGLDAEAARYLVDEMSKQVDWTTSFRRSA